MTIDVARLPKRELAIGTKLHRIHAAAHDPWFFSEDELGRFNPVGVVGRGSCYWAEDPLGAWVESFRTRILLSEAEVRLQAISTVELDEPLEVVDLTDRRALGAGATAALTSGADYGESQAVAAMLQGVVGGVRWRVRHDLEQRLIGVAVFGPRGSRPEGHWGPTNTEPISRELIRSAEDAFGYRVLPVSAS